MNMTSNCNNCIFREQWCEEENKCPLFKEDPELEDKPKFGVNELATITFINTKTGETSEMIIK